MDLFDPSDDDEFDLFPFKDGIKFPHFHDDNATSQDSRKDPYNGNDYHKSNYFFHDNKNNSEIRLSKSLPTTPVMLSQPPRPPSSNNLASTTNFNQNLKQNSKNSQNSTENAVFEAAIQDPTIKINPMEVGFIPSSFWSNSLMTFGDIVSTFFQRKNNSKCRFPHKLYNALILSTLGPRLGIENMFEIIGIKWFNDRILYINQKNFARLLGIKAVEGSLFHQQGNFPSHGFVEIDPSIVKILEPNFDFTKNRLLTHTDGIFVKGCTEGQIASCKWNSLK
ncbi:hypothetical protein TRFO_23508 [Tritrichomonas foetus]|uniref:Initiator binding domain-containing protein n=1 Tax=Tritrichomonas foetus TaxID=1144522 RepID=A0A1J4K9N7_9EUKA|nr:hypothetical protein TRFO_23508 [Tritrichomonas foetus]|eukprot:OHT08135.1 hypothetical protein TRFO_23508 [Tritrichomonas foetus]